METMPSPAAISAISPPDSEARRATARLCSVVGIGMGLGGLFIGMRDLGGAGHGPRVGLFAGIELAVILVAYGIPGMILIACADWIRTSGRTTIFTAQVTAAVAALLNGVLAVLSGIPAVLSVLTSSQVFRWSTPLFETLVQLALTAALITVSLRANRLLKPPAENAAPHEPLSLREMFTPAGVRRCTGTVCVLSGLLSLVVGLCLVPAALHIRTLCLTPDPDNLLLNGKPPELAPDALAPFNGDYYLYAAGLPREERQTLAGVVSQLVSLNSDQQRLLEVMLCEHGAQLVEGLPRPLQAGEVQKRAQARSDPPWSKTTDAFIVEFPATAIRIEANRICLASRTQMQGGEFPYPRPTVVTLAHYKRNERSLAEAAPGVPPESMTTGQVRTIINTMASRKIPDSWDYSPRQDDAYPKNIRRLSDGTLAMKMRGIHTYLLRSGEFSAQTPEEIAAIASATLLPIPARFATLLIAATCCTCAAAAWLAITGIRRRARGARLPAGLLLVANAACAGSWIVFAVQWHAHARGARGMTHRLLTDPAWLIMAALLSAAWLAMGLVLPTLISFTKNGHASPAPPTAEPAA